MNEQGFAKRPIVRTIEGEKGDLHLGCGQIGKQHYFEEAGRIQKLEVLRGLRAGKRQLVMYQVYFCRCCLLHVYSEVQRADIDELGELGEQIMNGLVM